VNEKMDEKILKTMSLLIIILGIAEITYAFIFKIYRPIIGGIILISSGTFTLRMIKKMYRKMIENKKILNTFKKPIE
jgi:hypothetical protein